MQEGLLIVKAEY